MANLAIKRADPGEAARELEASIRESLPTAGVSTRTVGEPEQRSLVDAIGHELGGYFRSREAAVFSVSADASTPRPIRIDAQYIAVGRGAGPGSILYLTRLGSIVPGVVGFERGKFRSGTFTGETEVARVLSAVPNLGSAIWKLLQPSVVYGSTVLTIEPSAEVLPDEDGAFFAVISAPARKTLGLGGYRLDLGAYLDIANGIDRAIAAAPGVTPAPTLNAPLPR